MSEYIIHIKDAETIYNMTDFPFPLDAYLREEVVRCRDCRHLNMPKWDNTLAMLYGEPPLTCDLLSMNEWRMDGNRRVAETTFHEVEPNDFCSWGERAEE